MPSSLDWPPRPIWMREGGFSHEAERRIHAGFVALGQSDTVADAYLRAFQEAAGSVKQSQSLRQQLRSYYVMGAALIGGGASELGLEYLEVGNDIAEELLDSAAAAQMAHLAGAAERGRSHYARAIEYQSYCLDRLRRLEDDGLPVDAGLRLDVLNALASNSFMVEQYVPAGEYLAEARRVAAHIPEHEHGVAQIAWIQALLLRWRGHPQRALTYALEAAAIYERGQTPTARMALGRLSTVLSEIAYDVVELPAHRIARFDRAVHRELAQKYARLAITIARETADTDGMQTARLTRARQRTGAKGSASAQRAIEAVIASARQRDDMVTLCQAQTALARHLAGHGQRDAALDTCQAAWELARRYNMPALGAWARRMLLEAEEMRDVDG